MPLDDLIESIETLKERIRQQEALLRQSEMWTRYALIDPFLRALDWDTEDLTQVQPEYQTAGGRADYALLAGDKPCLFLEAKKLGVPLSEGFAQSINYCIQQGTRYFVVTDGQRWEMYDIHKPVPLVEKTDCRLRFLSGTYARSGPEGSPSLAPQRLIGPANSHSSTHRRNARNGHLTSSSSSTNC